MQRTRPHFRPLGAQHSRCGRTHVSVLNFETHLVKRYVMIICTAHAVCTGKIITALCNAREKGGIILNCDCPDGILAVV